MRPVQVLSRLAVSRLPAAAPDALRQAGHHVARALRQANARAWIAVEILLAGEEFWERAQLTWERQLEHDFYIPVRAFLDGCAERGPAKTDPALCAQRSALQALEAASASGLLTSGSLDPADLVFPDDGADRCAVESSLLWELADNLDRDGYGELRPLIALSGQNGDPLIVLLVAASFRQAVRSDADLFGGLADVYSQACSAGVEELSRLAEALDRQRGRIDAILADLRQQAPTVLMSPQPADAASGEMHLRQGLARAQRGEVDQAISEFTAAVQRDPASAEAHIHRGDAHRLQGNYAQALADFGAALRLDPSNAVALVQRGQVHWLMGQPREAIADYTAALEIDATSAVAYYHRGKALAAAREFDAAIVNLSEALRLDPFFAWALHDLGDAYAALGNQERAIANYSQVLQQNPLATLSYLRRGDAYMAQGDDERAIADYTGALRLDPHNTTAFEGRGVAYRRQGKHEQAELDLTRALELDPTSGRLFMERGLLRQAQEDNEAALRDFDAVVRFDPENAEAYFRRGLAHEALGNLDKSLEDLSQALRRKPDHALAFTSRGFVYACRGEVDLALADLTTAIGFDPTLAAAYVNRAKILSRTGGLDEALNDSDLAVHHGPMQPQAYIVRGSVLAQRNEYLAAVEDFSQALRLSPLNAQAYFLRGVARRKLNNTHQALADLSEALRLDPRHARAYLQRAVLRHAEGQPELALEDLAHAARLDRRHAAAYLGQLGNVHAAHGQFECAVADYSVALSLDPNNATVLAARQDAWKAHNMALKAKAPVKVDHATAPALEKVAAASVARPAPTSKAAPAPTQRVPVLASASAVFQAEPLPQRSVEDTGWSRAEDTPLEREAEPTASGTFVLPMQVQAQADAGQGGDEEDAGFELDDEDPGFELAKGYNMGFDEPAELTVDVKESGDIDLFEAEQAEEEEKRKAKQEIERARMANELAKRLAEEKRKKEASHEAIRAKMRRPSADDDDEERLAWWKKGVIAAGALVAFYMVGSTALGFIMNIGRTSVPRTYPVTGKVVFADGKPVSGGNVFLFPKDGNGFEANGALNDNGEFSVTSFRPGDGACRGKYVVVYEPGAKPKFDKSLIPMVYSSQKASPWVIEVTSGDNNLQPLRIE